MMYCLVFEYGYDYEGSQTYILGIFDTIELARTALERIKDCNKISLGEEQYYKKGNSHTWEVYGYGGDYANIYLYPVSHNELDQITKDINLI